MVLFMDGFSFGDVAHICGVVSPFAPSCKYVNYSSAQSVNSVVAAPGSAKALQFENSGFNQQTLTRMLGSGTNYCTGVLVKYNGSAIGNTSSTLIRYENGPTIINPGGGGSGHDGGNTSSVLTLQIKASDLTLSLYTGQYGTDFQPGALLWNSAGVFTASLNAWYFIELQVNSASGTWSLYVDDVLLKTQTDTIPGVIDRVSTRSESFEVHDVANFYVTDGEQLGPCRVTGFPPNFGSTHEWVPLYSPNLSQIQEFGNRPGLNTPDDDISFVEAKVFPATDFYGFAAPLCFGRILALALNVDCEAVAGSPTVDWLVRKGTFNGNLGTSPTLVGGYTIQQGISPQNPSTGTYWTDADIAAWLFGFSLSSAGGARVTQFCLEKLVTLRNVPFDCGQGSYSFTS